MFKTVRWFWCLKVLELGLFVPPGLLSSLCYLVSVLVVGQVLGSSTCFLPPSCWAVLANGKPQWEMRREGTLRSLPPRFSLQGHFDQMSYFFRQPALNNSLSSGFQLPSFPFVLILCKP